MWYVHVRGPLGGARHCHTQASDNLPKAEGHHRSHTGLGMTEGHSDKLETSPFIVGSPGLNMLAVYLHLLHSLCYLVRVCVCSCSTHQ